MENNEEKNIQDAQTQEVEEVATKKIERKKKKRDFYVELALFFILGILIGIAFKTEAVERITIGFEDYKMKIKSQDYDINKIEADLIEKQKQAQAEEQKESVPQSSEENPTQEEVNQ